MNLGVSQELTWRRVASYWLLGGSVNSEWF